MKIKNIKQKIVSLSVIMSLLLPIQLYANSTVPLYPAYSSTYGSPTLSNGDSTFVHDCTKQFLTVEDMRRANISFEQLNAINSELKKPILNSSVDPGFIEYLYGKGFPVECLQSGFRGFMARCKYWLKGNLPPILLTIGAGVALFISWKFVLIPYFAIASHANLVKACDEGLRAIYSEEEIKENIRKSLPHIHTGLRQGEPMVIPADCTDNHEVSIVPYDAQNPQHVRIVAESLELTQAVADMANEPIQNPVTLDVHRPEDRVILPVVLSELPAAAQFWKMKAQEADSDISAYIRFIKYKNLHIVKQNDRANVFPLPGWLIYLEDPDTGHMRLEYFNPTNKYHMEQVLKAYHSLLPISPVLPIDDEAFYNRHNANVIVPKHDITNYALRQIDRHDVLDTIDMFITIDTTLDSIDDAPTFATHPPEEDDLLTNSLFQCDFKARDIEDSHLEPKHLISLKR
jgi:hypothetical protein